MRLVYSGTNSLKVLDNPDWYTARIDLQDHDGTILAYCDSGEKACKWQNWNLVKNYTFPNDVVLKHQIANLYNQTVAMAVSFLGIPKSEGK